MGKFTNTMYNNTVNSLTDAMKSTLKNNFYKYTDKPPTPVTYFHINKDATSLDEGAQIAFNNVGEDSPLRFNMIKDMMLYGIDSPIGTTYSQEEFGVESQPVEGEAVLLPNTIAPYPDDQFMIRYMDQDLIFKVTHVDSDTLENGSNMYKINFSSSSVSKDDLLKQVIEEYTFLVDNIGTELNPLLKSNVVDYLNELDNTLVSLKQYFKRLFYNQKVQTFTFRYLEKNFYDPYMVEFIKRNHILDDDGEFIYIQHQTTLDTLFPITYRNTMFSCLEKKDAAHIDGYAQYGAAKLIEDPYTIFENCMDQYWEMWYDYPEGYEGLSKIPCFKDQFIDHAAMKELLESKQLSFYNIIIKYLWDDEIDWDDIKTIDSIHYDQSPTLFYAIPCIIFCLTQTVNKIQTVEKNTVQH